MSYLIFYLPVEKSGRRFALHRSLCFTRGLPVWVHGSDRTAIVYPENQKVRCGKRIRCAIVFDENTTPPTLVMVSRGGIVKENSGHRMMPKFFISEHGDIVRATDNEPVMYAP